MDNIHSSISENTSLVNGNSSQSRKVVIISGTEYPITPQLYRLMRFFHQSEVICPTNTHAINCITTEVWELIVQILEELQYDLQLPPPKVSSSSARDYLQERLVERLDCTPLRLLNQLHQGCHFLKLEPLRRSVACYLACKVYFKYSQIEFRTLKSQLNVQTELDSQKMQEYKQRFPFIN